MASWPVRGHTQQLAPVIGVMGAVEHELADVLAAARDIGVQIVVVRLDTKNDFYVAFATVVETGAGAVMIMGSRSFDDRSDAVVEQLMNFDLFGPVITS